MRPVNVAKVNKIRRLLFEKPVTLEGVKRYILAKGGRISYAVNDCFKFSRGFYRMAHTLTLALNNGIKTRRIFNHMVIASRNNNYWLWTAVYIAQIEKGYGVDLVRDTDKIIITSEDPDLKDLTKIIFKNHSLGEYYGYGTKGFQADSFYGLEL